MIRHFVDYNLKKSSHSKLDAIVSSYYELDNVYDVISLIKSNKEYLFVGRMSKILFAFVYKNINVIKFLGKRIIKKDNLLIVESGITLFELGKYAIKNGISGFEKIMTIPGNLGGSVFNNVSFLDQVISQNILFVEIVDHQGDVRILSKDEIEFKYREIKCKYESYFIYRIIFKIKKVLRLRLFKKYRECLEYRLKYQPRILSLGSTFKNPYPLKAYQLIEKYLDFKELNNVKLNCMHLNFIELHPDLEYLNLVKLIERIQEVLYNKIGLHLKTEIKIIY